MTILELDSLQTATATALDAVLDGLDLTRAAGAPALTPEASEAFRLLAAHMVRTGDAGHRLSASPLPPLLSGDIPAPFDTYRDAEAWYRRKTRLLTSVVRLAETNGHDGLCQLLYACLEPMVASLHDLATLGEMTPHAMAAARRADDPEALARTLLVAGAWHKMSDRPKDALDCYSEAISIYAAQGDDDLAAAALNRRGAARMAARELDGAEQDFQRVIELARGRDAVMVGLAQMNLCAVELERGEFSRAVAAGLEADSTLTDAGADPAWQLESSFQLVEAFTGLGNLDQAEECAMHARDLMTNARMIPITIGGHIAIGLLRLAQGRCSESLADFTQARLLAANASPWRIADTDEGMGRAYLALGEADQAVSLLQRALATRRDAGVAFATARTSGLLADALDAAGWPEEAAECRAEGLSLLTEVQDTAARALRTALGTTAR